MAGIGAGTGVVVRAGPDKGEAGERGANGRLAGIGAGTGVAVRRRLGGWETHRRRLRRT